MRWLKWRKGASAATGREGERAAERHLWWRGYRILHRNWGTRQGEIDLIVERHGVCIFVEVKTRSAAVAGDWDRDPAEAVDARKRGRMRAAARIFLAGFEPVAFPHRFDVISVTRESGGRCRVREHREAAFDPLQLTEITEATIADAVEWE